MHGPAARLLRLGVAFAVVASLSACGDDPADGDPGASPPRDESTTTAEATTTTVMATTTTDVPPTTLATAATPEEALELWFASHDTDYAGDCQQATLEDDLGKDCTVLAEDRGDTRIYNSGPTFSEFKTWLLMRETFRGWAVVETASSSQAAPHPW